MIWWKQIIAKLYCGGGLQFGFDFCSENVSGVCFGYRFRTPKHTPVNLCVVEYVCLLHRLHRLKSFINSLFYFRDDGYSDRRAAYKIDNLAIFEYVMPLSDVQAIYSPDPCEAFPCKNGGTCSRSGNHNICLMLFLYKIISIILILNNVK